MLDSGGIGTLGISESGPDVKGYQHMWQILSRVSREIRDIDPASDLDTVLPALTRGVAEAFGVPAAGILLWDEPKDNLVVRANWGLTDEFARQHRMPGESVIAAFEGDEVQGDRRPAPRTDALDKQDLIEQEGVHAVLSTPLFAQNQLIGLLNLYSHDRSDQFDPNEQGLAQIFANLAVIAIQNAERFEELEKSKDREYASQVVAWLGLFGADWQHTIHQKIFSIGNYIDGLRRWIAGQEVAEDVTTLVNEALDGIETVTESIRNVQFTGPIPSDTPREAIGETTIDPELETMVSRWAEDRSDVRKVYDLNCPEFRVNLPPQWLRVALEKLVNNALKAMPKGGTLTITTQPVDDMIHITIADTGQRGIPDFALPHFLKRPIKRPPGNKTPGTGKGVLIARFVALSYGGDLNLVSTGKGQGTKLRLTLPISNGPTSSTNDQPKVQSSRERGASR